MTPRQRILATMHHQLPDRTPTNGWFHSEVVQMLKAHYQTDDWGEVLKQLGIEGWGGVHIPVTNASFERQKTVRPEGQPGPEAIWLDANTYEDVWGVRYTIGSDQRYEEWISGPLEGVDTVDRIQAYPFPKADDIAVPDDLGERVRQQQAAQCFVSGGIPNPFKTAWQLRGMVDFLCDYAGDRALLEALYNPLFELYTHVARAYAAAGVDMITVVGDVGMQDRLMIDPEAWRAIDKPRFKTLIAQTREVKPDVLFFFHSDGNIMPIVQDLIEVGFNVINPIQPECMDPFEVKRRWGERIVLDGGISLQRTLPFGSEDDVREEVEQLIKGCGYNGGLVVFPSNVIQPDTQVKNIIACFHAARDFDLSTVATK